MELVLAYTVAVYDCGIEGTLILTHHDLRVGVGVQDHILTDGWLGDLRPPAVFSC